jgi:hypothetical protein
MDWNAAHARFSHFPRTRRFDLIQQTFGASFFFDPTPSFHQSFPFLPSVSLAYTSAFLALVFASKLSTTCIPYVPYSYSSPFGARVRVSEPPLRDRNQGVFSAAPRRFPSYVLFSNLLLSSFPGETKHTIIMNHTMHDGVL